MAVVELLKSRTSRDSLLMHLLLLRSIFHFNFECRHLPGNLNTAADAISRNNIPLFYSLVPQIPHTTVPQAVINLLVSQQPEWGSQHWTELFLNLLNRGYPRQQQQSTAPDGNDTCTSAGSSH